METMIEKYLSSGGQLAALIFVVWIFLRHLREESELNRQLFKDIHAEHLTSRRETHDAIHESSVAMRELAVSIHTCPLKAK